MPKSKEGTRVHGGGFSFLSSNEVRVAARTEAPMLRLYGSGRAGIKEIV